MAERATEANCETSRDERFGTDSENDGRYEINRGAYR